jgi:type II secretory pathway component PulF
VKDTHQLATFHRTLAEMCRAEIPLGRAFQLLQEDLQEGPLRDVSAAMAADVENGMPLAEAYAKHSSSFPPMYGSLVQAGVESGDLPGTLEEIARHASLHSEARSRLRRLMAYPLMVLAFMVGMIAFMHLYVVPTFEQIYLATYTRRGSAIELPLLTRMVFSLPVLLMAVSAVLVGAVAGFALLRDPVPGLKTGSRLGLRMPGIGPLRLNAALASFTGTLALLLRRGLAMDRALDLAALGADAPFLRTKVQAMAEDTRKGSSLTDAAREQEILPPSILWLIGGGEQQGEVSGALDDIASLYRERFQRGLETFQMVLVPLMEVGLGILTLIIILGTMYPILHLQRALM